MAMYFNTPIPKINYDDPEQAVRQLEQHLRKLQEQLEWTLSNLDSTNITEINTGQTNITGGGVTITDDQIDLKGTSSERFRVGYDKTASMFRFEVTDRDGVRVLYLGSDGRLVIGKRAMLTVDGGIW